MTVVVQDAPALRRSWLDTAFAFSRRQPLGTFGLVVVVVAAIAGLSAEWIAPYSPTANDFARHVSTATLLLHRRAILDLAARRV